MHRHFDYSRTGEIRAKYIPVERVVKLVDPKESDVIVDIGSGDGFYTEKFAKVAKKVYAVEPNPKGNEILRQRMKDLSLSNVIIIEKDVCEEFQPSDFNKVFFSNSFHDIDCRNELISHIIDRSPATFSITLVEFKKDSEIGPPSSIKISESELREYFEKLGFKLVDTENFTFHYVHKYELKK